MMLTIHGLPVMVKYHELKALIQRECNISDFILDNLTADVDGSKKVRIGVADESEGAHLSKCLNGFRMGGNVLRVMPVGKPPNNQPQRGGFMTNQPGNFGNQSGKYSNQPGNFSNQSGNFNNQQNRSGPWGSTTQSNQWVPNQQPHNQMQQNNFKYQQNQNQQVSPKRPGGKPFNQPGGFNQSRAAPEQGFGFTPKPNLPPQGGGNQFDGQQGYPPREPNEHSPWNKPTLQQKPSFGKPDIPTFENKREISKDFDKARPGFLAAPERRLSPHARRESPHAVGISHGRAPDRRISPSGRRVSPNGRRMSPGLRVSPGRRMSPSDRRSRKSPGRASPHKRLSSPPRGGRYSPPRRHDKAEFDARSKHVRPAYEPDAKAPNQALYSGGYRPNEKTPYPSHQADQRSAPWQDRDKNVYPGMKKQDDDRRMMRGGESEAKRSPVRKSRSPSRRDGRERSPFRDRYRRHSPSPRSPRRSWALEKRRSPEINDAPPPPVWPGQNQESHYGRSTAKPEPTKHVPVWNHRSYEETEEELRRENRSYNEEQMRMRRDAGPRNMNAPVSRRELSPRHHDFKPPEERFNRDPKFEPRDPKFAPRDPKFEPRDPKFEPRDPKFEQRDTKFDVREPKFEPRVSKFDQRDPNFQQHVTRFDQRDPKFEPRDPKFEPRDPKFEPRDPKFEPRDPKLEQLRERMTKFDSRDPKYQLHVSRFAPHEPKFEPRVPSFEARDPKFELRDTKFDNRGPKFEPRGNEFGSGFQSTGPKFQPRDPDFEPRDPKFEPRDSANEQRQLKFKPTFEPVDPKSQQNEPKFESRESKYASRHPKFESRDHKFEHDDFKDHNLRRIDDISEKKNYPDRDKYRDYQRSEPHRDDFRRDELNRLDDNKDICKAQDIIEKEFEDIYKRTVEFKQKVEQLKRGDHSRDRDSYSRDSRRREHGDDRREMMDSDRRPREDFHDMDLERCHQDGRPDSRHSAEYNKQRDRQPEWKPHEMPSKRFYLTPAIKTKRDKAVEEISSQLIKKYGNFEMDEEIKDRVNDELKLTLGKILFDLFGEKDVSYIELVVKFNSKHNAKDELKIFEDVMACFPKQHRMMMKRLAQDTARSEIPAKRSAPENNLKEDVAPTIVNETYRSRAKALQPKHNVRLLKKPVPVKRPVTKAVAAPKRKAPPPATAPPPKRAAPAPAPAADGHHELDAAAALAVEAELQRIMIEVWQQLPDKASTEVESVALEMMRNEVSDDLRNVLGLNVTKRLLNVFNPLNVKVHFSTKPERKFLSLFLKRYNFVAFKRIVKVENTFAAQVKTVADYDNLCSTKKIFCGAAKLTITPCYRYTQCPKNLKTVYGSPIHQNATSSNKEYSKKESETMGAQNEIAAKEVVINKNNDNEDSLKKDVKALKSNKLTEKKSKENVEENIPKSVVKIANTATQTTTTNIETDSSTKKASHAFVTSTKSKASETANIQKSNAAVESTTATSAPKSTANSKVEKPTETKEKENNTADVLSVKTTTTVEKTLSTINQVADNNKPNVSKTLSLPTARATVTTVPNTASAKITVAKVTPNKTQAQSTANKTLQKTAVKSTETKVAVNKVPPATEDKVTPNKTQAQTTAKPAKNKAPANTTVTTATAEKTAATSTVTKGAVNKAPPKATEIKVTPNKTQAQTTAKATENKTPAETTGTTAAPEKTATKSNETKVVVNKVPSKATEIKATSNKTQAQTTAKATENKGSAETMDTSAAPGKTAAKLNETKVAVDKASPKATDIKVAPNKTQAQTTIKANENKTPAKTKVTTATPAKTAATFIETKATVKEIKVIPNKTPLGNKATKTIANPNKNANNLEQDKAKTAATTKPTPKNTSRTNKVNAAAKKTSAINVKKQRNAKNVPKDDDFEELDDHELYLYLMSAGIALDECGAPEK